MNFDTLKEIDSQNMFGVLKAFPEQIKNSIEIAQNPLKFKPFNKLIILGMGGSAIGGDLLNTFYQLSSSERELIIIINRDYNIPFSIDDNTAIIASSYSGNTEETISAFNQALKVTHNIIAISSGGELTKMANDNSIPVIVIPSGYQPRCAIAYSFFPMLYLLIHSNLFSQTEKVELQSALIELSFKIEQLSTHYSQIRENNSALEIAKKLKGKIPIIYSSNSLYPINLRWRSQIQENAKNCAFGNVLPEMNHNEINCFSFPEIFKNNAIVILISDPSDNKRNKTRLRILKDILNETGVETLQISSDSNSLLTRYFELIYLADWVSYYLAILNNIDPTPIPLINKLKNALYNLEN